MRVPYAQAVYGQEEIDAVVEVLVGSPLSLMNGDSVREFERRVAQLFGKGDGVMVNSGSSANLLALAALRLPEASEIVTPALNFATTVAPIVQLGHVPAFVDVEPDTFNVDVDGVEAMIGRKTAALMIPNLIGNLPDWGRLREIADEHGLAVIEDSADTLGSLYRGAPTGTLSDISTTSFYASHVVTAAGFGGMVCSSDPEMVRAALLLRGWGRQSSLLGESEQPEDRFEVSVDGIPYDSKFVFSEVGYNFLPSEIAAAFGLVQLKRLDDYVAQRIANFASLLEFFSGFSEWFTLPRQQVDSTTGWLAFPMVIKPSAPFSRRDLQIHFEKEGIQTRTVFTGNILRQPGFVGIPRVESPEGYPNADAVMTGGILIGCHGALGPEHIEYVRQVFSGFVESVVAD